MADMTEIIESLKELCADSTVPKNLKEVFSITIKDLSSDEEDSIKVNKALHELEAVADDVNIQPYTRTQIWGLVSKLENL